MQEVVPTLSPRLEVAPEVARYVQDRGGRLYVWAHHHRCCGGGYILLDASTEPPSGDHHFRELPAPGFTLLLDAGRRPPPEVLNIELRGLRGNRIAAYWNGCAYVL